MDRPYFRCDVCEIPLKEWWQRGFVVKKNTGDLKIVCLDCKSHIERQDK